MIPYAKVFVAAIALTLLGSKSVVVVSLILDHKQCQHKKSLLVVTMVTYPP